MVRFYCDTGYTRVPDTEIAICQVMGTWSKTVPACLMAGCQVSFYKNIHIYSGKVSGENMPAIMYKLIKVIVPEEVL